MSKRNFLSCVVLAAGSFGVTLALIGPARLNADGPNQPQGAYAAPAKPTLNGVQFAIRLPDTESSPRTATIAPAKNLKFEVVATNTLATAVEMPAKVSLSTSEPVQRMSRMGPIYQESWQSEGTILLEPNETRVISLSADVELKPASNVMIQLSSPNPNEPPATPGVRRPAQVRPSLRLAVQGEPPAKSTNTLNNGSRPAPATRPTVVVANFTLDR